MVDIDFFKAFNDTYGHLEGDECLRRVAGALHKAVRRPSDFLGRYGGEEFVAVLPDTDSRRGRQGSGGPSQGGGLHPDLPPEFQ